MSRQIVRSIALAAMLVLAIAGTGVASAADHGEHSAETETAMTVHTSVHMHADEDGLVLEVQHEGNGSALVTIEGTDATYADAGTYEVADERTFHLAPPERPSGIRVTVDTPRGEFVRTVEFETVQVGCGDASEPLQVPTRVVTAWTVEYGDEQRSDERVHDLPTPGDVPCPDLPAPGVGNWTDHDGDDPEPDNGSVAGFEAVNEAFEDHDRQLPEVNARDERGNDRVDSRPVDPAVMGLLHGNPTELRAVDETPDDGIEGSVKADADASAAASVAGFDATAGTGAWAAVSTDGSIEGNAGANATAEAGE